MLTTLFLLSIALLVAFLAPIVASIIPGRAVPEVVLLVFAGAILGRWLPIANDTGMEFFSELGMAFLFLMAGFEIEPTKMSGKMTRHALLSWLVSLGLALLFIQGISSVRFSGVAGYAFAIALTTTAYGTLAPIMRERGLLGTRVGKAVTTYGALGEILPIVAMAFLLSTRDHMATSVLLLFFIVMCVLIATFPLRARKLGGKLQAFLQSNAAASTEAAVRAVTLLLVFLVFLAERLGFDAALGAFAAGFTLRGLLPTGNDHLELRLRVIASGFLVPVFFFVSGATIDLAAAFADLKLLFGFIALLVLVRGVVIGISLNMCSETRSMSWQEKFSAAAYCTMALPLVVAVTRIAVNSGAMGVSEASVLVTAGALTVLLIPILTSLVRVTSATHPVEAAREIAAHEPVWEVIEQHRLELRREEQHLRDLRRHACKHKISSTDYLATGHLQRDKQFGENARRQSHSQRIDSD
ncbi:cation:proton antiporter [Olegusella massiliensis]|uniref:cation:proton antiporter n=1 Tax=Olegusella massiliensis TaxID=1776381 RepID=UPI0040557DC9